MARSFGGTLAYQAKITRTALILVGRVLADADFTDSKLYAPDHVHVLRPKRRA